MPRYLITFEDGSTVEKEASSGDLAKQAAKAEARNKTGATSRTDTRVKVKHVVDLDGGRGPTDPRNAPQTGAAASSGDRGRDDRDRSSSDRSRDERNGTDRGDRDRGTRDDAGRDRTNDRDRDERDEQARRDREAQERRDREGRS